jgi:Bacterial regulatory proteins, tetR family
VGRTAQISRAAILSAGLAIADEHGLSAVTMQAVARRLRVTPMALYRHVANKDDLLDGPPPSPTGERDRDGCRDRNPSSMKRLHDHQERLAHPGCHQTGTTTKTACTDLPQVAPD